MRETIDWLLEPDEGNPGVRYLALTDLLRAPADDSDVVEARAASTSTGQVPALLAAQQDGGSWIAPGPGYLPKYRSSVWSVIYLAQLGADPADERVRAGGEHLLASAIATNGAFTYSGAPSGSIPCVTGNVAASLLDLGFGRDARLAKAIDLAARFVTGDGVAPAEERDAPIRYYRSGTCGPGFLCSANDGRPCAWGAVKLLRAFTRVPPARRTPAIDAALATTVDFLLSVDPSTAAYPTPFGGKPSRSWFRNGFPVFYVTDVLQVAEALREAGYGADRRLQRSHELLLAQRPKSGRWRLEYSYEGKTWADAGKKGEPSKWVTLRALRALEERLGPYRMGPW